MDALVRSFGSIDWTNLEEVETATKTALVRMSSDLEVVRQTLLAVPTRPELVRLCEHYDILDKIVLFDDPDQGVRVRLHVFLPGYFDRPHNHRWSYTSLILSGRYRHALYGTAEGLNEKTDSRKLQPVMVRDEHRGSLYTLHHSMVHAVTAEPYTVSLVIRGPSVKQRFLVMDRVTGESWWQYGAKHDDPAVAKSKRMSADRLEEATGLLLGSGVL
jgi:hypothetical protein